MLQINGILLNKKNRVSVLYRSIIVLLIELFFFFKRVLQTKFISLINAIRIIWNDIERRKPFSTSVLFRQVLPLLHSKSVINVTKFKCAVSVLFCIYIIIKLLFDFLIW